MATVATLNGVYLTNATEIAWAVTGGVTPYTTVVEVATKHAERIRAMMGKPTTLTVTGSRASFTAQRVFIVNEDPGGTPHTVRFTIADKRWLWPRFHILRRYNVRRRTGDRRLLTEGFPSTVPAGVDDYAYEVATLKGGQMWGAKDAADDVLTVLDLERPTTKDLPARSVPMEGIEIDDDGASAVSRLLGFIPGAQVAVALDGSTFFYDETDLSRTASVLARFGLAVVGGGQASRVDYGGIRPRSINVLFTCEQELKFTSVDEGGGYSRRADRTKYLENVLPVPDLSLTVSGRTVSRGTWITIDEAFAAWGVPSLPGGMAAPALSHSIVRELWFGGRLEALYNGLGMAIPSADWAARIRAVRQHYRQTYRISPYWMNRIRALRPERVGVIDRENGVRAPAFVTADYAFQPSTRGLLSGANLQAYIVNVTDAYSDDLATAKQAPAFVSVVDEQLGVVHLSYQTDVIGHQAQMYPCAFAGTLPAANFRAGAGSAITSDGYVTEGVNPIALSANHRVAIVLTAVPSAPNTNDQLFRVRITPGDAASVGMPVGPCEGPEWDVRLGPGVATARFMWLDAAESQIDKLFGGGSSIAPAPGERPTYAIGHGLEGAGLLVDGDELRKVAKAVGAGLYSALVNRIVGSRTSMMDAEMEPQGNISAVVHTLGVQGELNTTLRFDRTTGRVDMTAFLDNDTRRKLFRMVSP